MANNNQELPTITFTEGDVIHDPIADLRFNTIIVNDSKGKIIRVKHFSKYLLMETMLQNTLDSIGEKKFLEWVEHQEIAMRVGLEIFKEKFPL